VREGVQQRGRAGELEQVRLGLLLVVDLVGQRARAPVVVALDRSSAAGDLSLDVGEDLGSLLFRCLRGEQQHEVIEGGSFWHSDAPTWAAADYSG
jgi:hypothetical protein